MMIKKIAMLSLGIYAQSVVAMTSFSNVTACAPAVPSNSPEFCASFKKTAECYCTKSGLPQGMCKDMTTLYNRMISTFKTVERACAFQHDTPTQVCVDDWNCYRFGGRNSKNELCSGTGQAC